MRKFDDIRHVCAIPYWIQLPWCTAGIFHRGNLGFRIYRRGQIFRIRLGQVSVRYFTYVIKQDMNILLDFQLVWLECELCVCYTCAAIGNTVFFNFMSVNIHWEDQKRCSFAVSDEFVKLNTSHRREIYAISSLVKWSMATYVIVMSDGYYAKRYSTEINFTLSVIKHIGVWS